MCNLPKDESIDLDHKTDGGSFEPGSNGLPVSTQLPIVLILEHTKSWSKFSVLVLIKDQVFELKIRFQELLNVLPENQEWFFKNRRLDDTETIAMIGIKKNEIILCQDKIKWTELQANLRPG